MGVGVEGKARREAVEGIVIWEGEGVELEEHKGIPEGRGDEVILINNYKK